MGHGFSTSTPFKRQRMKVITRDKSSRRTILSEGGDDRAQPRIGPEPVPTQPSMGDGRVHAQPRVGPVRDRPWSFLDAVTSWTHFLLGSEHELSPTSLKLGAKLKGHSTLSLSYPEPELIIMMLIIIPLNTKKSFILILIRCDGTSSRKILFYYYEITSLPLLHCIKQLKPDNIKGEWDIHKGVRDLILWDKNTLSTSSSFLILYLLPSPILYFHKSSLILPLMSFFTQIFLVLTWSSEGPLSTPLEDFVQAFDPEKSWYPPREIFAQGKPTWTWSRGHWIHHK
jgi:hypothetical protein